MKSIFDLTDEEARGITAKDLIDSGELPQVVIDWLLLTDEEKDENNPPGFVPKGREGCWNKAKRAAGHAKASDFYSFANWWFHKHC